MKTDVNKLLEKWSPVLEAGTPFKSQKVKRATAIMLENEFNEIYKNTGRKPIVESSNTEYSFDRSGDYSTSGDFYNIAIPMVRRTFPELIAHEIVGVQPLNGPVGLAFALRYRSSHSDAYEGDVDVELGHNTIDTDWSLTTPASAAEALGSAKGSGVGSDIGLGIGVGTHIKEVNMTIEKAQVEAKTRKLRSRWSLEVAQDLKAMHGLDLENEMMDILSYEITAEIDRELIEQITTCCTASTSTSSGWDFDTTTGRWEGEKYRELYNKLIREANQIAITTRRGAGNFVITHPTITAAFESTSSFTVQPVNSDVNTSMTGVSRVGSLDGRINVYRDTFATLEHFIVGYKGPSEYDTGVVYCPYVQLLANKTVFEDSFNPTIGLMSRYAIHTHIFGCANYYRYVLCLNMP